MYRVTYNRINDSMFTGLKYAEIYPDWDWVGGEPVKVIYALTWKGLNKKVKRWTDSHHCDTILQLQRKENYMYKDVARPIHEPTETVAGCVDIYDDVIASPHVFIKVAEMIHKWRDAIVHEMENDSYVVDKSNRSNVILDVNGDDYSTHPMFTYMIDTVRQYLGYYCAKYSADYQYLEKVQLLRYDVGQDYKAHSDSGPNFPRVVSALLYLNEVPIGGQTEFVNFGVSVDPKPGRLVIFPSNYAYTHIAHPPVEGKKYVFVFWTREKINFEQAYNDYPGADESIINAGG